MRRRYRKPQPQKTQGESPFFKPVVQEKLNVGTPGDKYELEADAMADKVVNNTGDQGGIQKKEGEEEIQQKPLADTITPWAQRKESTEEEPVQQMEEEEAVQNMEEEESVQQMEEEEAVQNMEEEEPVQQMEEEEAVQSMEEEEPIQQMEEEEAVQTKAMIPNTKNTGVERKLKNNAGKGNQMDPTTQQAMEQGFGADFSNVNIHTDSEAIQMSKDMGAQAFTHGNDIYFNEGKYNPNSKEGKHLLAHELTHTIQQGASNTKNVQKRIDANAPTIKNHLSRGPLDWAVTDHDATMAASYLRTIQIGSKEDFYDTVQHLDAGGYIAELNAEIPMAQSIRYSAMLSVINRITSGTLTTAEKIEYRPNFDWVNSSAIAQEVFDELKSGSIPAYIVNRIIGNLSFVRFSKFISLLPPTDNQDDLRLIQEYTITNSGETLTSLAAKQRTFMEGLAAGAGVSLEEYLTGEVAARGYGGAAATNWSSLTPEAQQDWRDRFAVIYTELQTNAIAPIQSLVNDAIAVGGGIKFNEESCEQNGAFAYSNGTNWVTVGISFVEAAEDNLSYVYANLAHEFGHDNYGSIYSQSIINSALTPSERVAAESSGNSLMSTYGYNETEIYGELREQSYIVPGHNPTDYPVNDIETRLNNIKTLYEPDVAYAIVWSLRNRINSDSTISQEAKDMFNTTLLRVFPTINIRHAGRIVTGN